MTKIIVAGCLLLYAARALPVWDFPAILKQISGLQNQPLTPENAIQRSRLYFYLSKASSPSDENKLIAVLEEGKQIAEEGLKIAPENQILEFWWVANVGAIASIKKNLGALKTLYDLEKKLIRFRETHADYGFGAADRVLGNMYVGAPRFISIGSKSKAEECFLRNYQKYPRFPGNVLSLVEFYLREERKPEALKVGQVLLDPSFITGADFGEFNIEKPDWSAKSVELIRELKLSSGGGT